MDLCRILAESMHSSLGQESRRFRRTRLALLLLLGLELCLTQAVCLVLFSIASDAAHHEVHQPPPWIEIGPVACFVLLVLGAGVLLYQLLALFRPNSKGRPGLAPLLALQVALCCFGAFTLALTGNAVVRGIIELGGHP